MTTDTDFDGCHRECRIKGKHSLVWCGCEFGVRPEPTVSMSVVFRDTDGQNSIGYDRYTIGELADLIEPALDGITMRLGPNSLAAVRRGESFRLSGGERWAIARQAASAVVRRNDNTENVAHTCSGCRIVPCENCPDRQDPWSDPDGLAQSGVDTPGCDCGHNGMGLKWHGTDCPYRRARSLPFATRVMEIFSLSHADAYGDLFWRVDGGELKLYANISDVFFWGGTDVEEIIPARLPVLERAYADLKAVEAEEFTAELYAARLRKMRPQGAYYPTDAHGSWRHVYALFDACGPERAVDVGNPKKAPAHGG